MVAIHRGLLEQQQADVHTDIQAHRNQATRALGDHRIIAQCTSSAATPHLHKLNASPQTHLHQPKTSPQTDAPVMHTSGLTGAVAVPVPPHEDAVSSPQRTDVAGRDSPGNGVRASRGSPWNSSSSSASVTRCTPPPPPCSRSPPSSGMATPPPCCDIRSSLRRMICCTSARRCIPPPVNRLSFPLCPVREVPGLLAPSRSSSPSTCASYSRYCSINWSNEMSPSSGCADIPLSFSGGLPGESPSSWPRAGVA